MPERNLRHVVIGCFALTALACSDPVPPPAEAGVYVEIGQSPSRPSATSCRVTTETGRLGGTPPSATSSGVPLIDGESGARITCSVTGGGPFSFSATARGTGLNFDITNGQVVAGGEGTATIGIYTPDTLGLGDANCKITAIDVKPGAIWAGFDCPNLIDPSNPGVHCGGKGYFVFQNCSK